MTLMQELYARATGFVDKNKATLERVACALLERESLCETEPDALIQHFKQA